MKRIRIPLTQNETLEVHRYVTGVVHLELHRLNPPEGIKGLEHLYSLTTVQREQLREALQ